MSKVSAQYRVFAQSDYAWGPHDVQLYLQKMETIPKPQRYEAKITWEPVAECAHTEPTIHLDERESVALMECLWKAGIRPRWEHSEGQLGATREHLGDLRKLLFHKMGVEL